eukprot:1333217-Lingulodinium_polyedra.AAC.1
MSTSGDFAKRPSWSDVRPPFRFEIGCAALQDGSGVCFGDFIRGQRIVADDFCAANRQWFLTPLTIM